jgi:SAM-dependent methyltransferase
VTEAPDARKDGWTSRALRVRSFLVCPKCKNSLTWTSTAGICVSCEKTYPYRNGTFFFSEAAQGTDPLDRLKERLKRHLGNAFYMAGIGVIAPTFPFSLRRALLRWIDPRSALIVDVGSGNHRWHEAVIALDAVDYPAVDIVADLAALPFRDESVDGFTSRSLLEHVWPLDAAIAELKRCTRPTGINLHVIPFLFPFHASPGDFQRLTHAGAAKLFDGWTLVEQYNATGPVTLLLVSLIEFLATACSFGVPRVKAVIYLLLCVVLFPIKILDAPFVRRSSWLTMAPTIVTVVRKPFAAEGPPRA